MYNIYSIRDILVGFGPLIVDKSDAIAIRNFQSLADNPSVPLRDYDLYQVGSFDSSSGCISPLSVPLLVARGVDFLQGGDSCASV